MKFGYWAVAVVVALVVWAVGQKSTYLDLYELTPSEANRTGRESCLGKKQCLLVYMAPWCPPCKRSIAISKGLIDLYRDSEEVGINIVIGKAAESELQSMARKIGDYSFVDVDGVVAEKANLGGIPHWIVVDEYGKITFEKSGEFLGSAADLAPALGLRSP